MRPSFDIYRPSPWPSGESGRTALFPSAAKTSGFTIGSRNVGFRTGAYRRCLGAIFALDRLDPQHLSTPIGLRPVSFCARQRPQTSPAAVVASPAIQILVTHQRILAHLDAGCRYPPGGYSPKSGYDAALQRMT